MSLMYKAGVFNNVVFEKNNACMKSRWKYISKLHHISC